MKYILSILFSFYSQNITYTKDIKPVFQTRCYICHNEGVPDRNWMDYKIAYSKRKLIDQNVYVDKTMPMGMDMPDSERKLIHDWIKEGAKE